MYAPVAIWAAGDDAGAQRSQETNNDFSDVKWEPTGDYFDGWGDAS